MLACIPCIGCADDDDFYTLDGVDIDFYGQIVDQNNDPVEGYELDYTLYAFMVAPNTKLPTQVQLKIITDSQGNFSIHRKGYKLLFNFKDVPGYEFIYAENPKTSFGYAHIALPDSFEASESNPFIFTLRKKGKPAFLIGTGTENDNKRIRRDDITQAFDVSLYLVEPWFDNNGLPGYLPRGVKPSIHGYREGEKDLRIQGQLSQDETQFNLEITPLVENSGIMISDELLYEAPETGYQTSVQLSVLPGTSGLEKYLYIKLENGKFYQRSLIEIYVSKIAPPSVSMIFRISNWINPEGSRNLEYDSDYNWEEKQWRYLLRQLRFLHSKGRIKTLEAKELVAEYGLESFPEWKTEEQFFDELRQLRAQKDAQNPKWWHKFEKE